jgi:hypothetical protein
MSSSNLATQTIETIPNTWNPCLQCRVKDLDCDRKNPCYHCKRRGQPSLCIQQETVRFTGPQNTLFGQEIERPAESELAIPEKAYVAARLEHERIVKREQVNWVLPNPATEKRGCFRRTETPAELQARICWETCNGDLERSKDLLEAVSKATWEAEQRVKKERKERKKAVEEQMRKREEAEERSKRKQEELERQQRRRAVEEQLRRRQEAEERSRRKREELASWNRR